VNVAAYADRRSTPQQRRYLSDPSLLTPVQPDIPANNPVDPAVYWDRRQAPTQPARRSPVGLLDTALLEDPLLAGVDQRRLSVYVDRRSVPQQRPNVSDPNLLAPAVADIPAPNPVDVGAYTDRRAVPAQRRYLSQPGLLDSALLENELLGGADTSKRINLPATHATRWWMPQQPPRSGNSPGLLDDALLEPPLLGGDVRRHRAAAGYWDRREVPQQRPYVSDPSFYPTVAPTDPLTFAWGVGGHYWLIYNQAAMLVDRREMPQQRLYESDPSLLSSALLEPPLLGGDVRRQYAAAAYTDRRQPAQPRPYLSVPQLDDLLGYAETLKRILTPATNVDRRRAPTQRRYISDPSFYPVPTPADPVMVAWGVGGHMWLLYNTPALLVDRRLAGQQRLYYLPPPPPVDCETPPPFSGVTVDDLVLTARPTSGTTGPAGGSTTRPFTGVTEDPC
jgi:hypothetical protein